MLNALEQILETAVGRRCSIGQVLIQRTDGGKFVLSHHDDEHSDRVEILRDAEDAAEIARYDDAGNYRPLKTAPSLRHGWRLEIVDLTKLRRALDCFYPGRLAMFAAWKQNRIVMTPVRKTLDRQSGMYRVAAKISDEQVDALVGNFCKSNGGCLRTILWKRDQRGTGPSSKLPPEKFEPSHDQTGRGERTIPLLCQEACNLLVNECRKAVKGEKASRSAGFPAVD
jgi:sirohydrochlorin cobaltochelatase